MCSLEGESLVFTMKLIRFTLLFAMILLITIVLVLLFSIDDADAHYRPGVHNADRVARCESSTYGICQP